jgi:hypothetical protein
VDYGDVLAGLHALASALEACGGYTASRDYMEQGMRAYEAAMAEGCPE